ncbi:MAG TPA: hypothetical protein VH054_01500, partial [Polyangiaceae bacterium]|nr:hypothetical protein [Polyangiaceae bacterium]
MRKLPKLDVAGSNPVSRSRKSAETAWILKRADRKPSRKDTERHQRVLGKWWDRMGALTIGFGKWVRAMNNLK